MIADDSNIVIQKLKDKIASFVKERDWDKFHTPKNLSMSIAIEAAELMEHFQWKNTEESFALLKNSKSKKEIEEELADIAIYVLGFCNLYGLDLSSIVSGKVAKNEEKYPIQLCKGKVCKKEDIQNRKINKFLREEK